MGHVFDTAQVQQQQEARLGSIWVNFDAAEGRGGAARARTHHALDGTLWDGAQAHQQHEHTVITNRE